MTIAQRRTIVRATGLYASGRIATAYVQDGASRDPRDADEPMRLTIGRNGDQWVPLECLSRYGDVRTLPDGYQLPEHVLARLDRLERAYTGRRAA